AGPIGTDHADRLAGFDPNAQVVGDPHRPKGFRDVVQLKERAHRPPFIDCSGARSSHAHDDPGIGSSCPATGTSGSALLLTTTRSKGNWVAFFHCPPTSLVLATLGKGCPVHWI